MRKAILYGSFAWFILIAVVPQTAKGNDHQPVCRWKLNIKTVIRFGTDTLPAPPKVSEKVAGKSAADSSSIKEVPKARKQVVPIPVVQQIKPIKTIKPIIKPVIKILN
jgi:hypothetical protein